MGWQAELHLCLVLLGAQVSSRRAAASPDRIGAPTPQLPNVQPPLPPLPEVLVLAGAGAASRGPDRTALDSLHHDPVCILSCLWHWWRSTFLPSGCLPFFFRARGCLNSVPSGTSGLNSCMCTDCRSCLQHRAVLRCLCVNACRASANTPHPPTHNTHPRTLP